MRTCVDIPCAEFIRARFEALFRPELGEAQSNACMCHHLHKPRAAMELQESQA